MSTYRPKGRKHFLYDFEIGGHRFYGSTGCTSKREADREEQERKAEAKRQIAETRKLRRQPMTFGVAATRYWEEAGKYAKTATGIEWSLAWLQREIGSRTRLSAIDGEMVARLVVKRRDDTVLRGGRSVKVAPATVNRTVTEVLRRILTRAAKVWEEPVSPVQWGKHLLKEPEERVRELRSEEEAALFAALRPDYHAVVRFAILTGCRLSECVNLRWQDVDWGGRQIWILGKGDKLAPIPMPPAVRELLWPLQGQHETSVFTYVAARASGQRRHGHRYPITYEGLKTAFRRDAKTVLAGYRFHDNRHTAGTRVLRASGNIKLAQKMLRHSSISTTTKYAHVIQDDILEAMEKAASAPYSSVDACDPVQRPKDAKS